MVLKTLSNDDLVVFSGFYIAPALYGRIMIKGICRIFSTLLDLTLFGLSVEEFYDNITNKLVDRLYDVVLRIKREGRILRIW